MSFVKIDNNIKFQQRQQPVAKLLFLSEQIKKENVARSVRRSARSPHIRYAREKEKQRMAMGLSRVGVGLPINVYYSLFVMFSIFIYMN
jgi:hypothetical protein